MSNNQTYTVVLNNSDLTSLIKGMSASDVYHQRLQLSEFSYPNELQSILDNNDRIKTILKDALKETVKVYPKSSTTSCLRPPETAKPALVAVDGGIHMLNEKLKEIKETIKELNNNAFTTLNLSEEQHYHLLAIELEIEDFLSDVPVLERSL